MTAEAIAARRRGAAWTKAADKMHALRVSRSAYLDTRREFMAATGHRARVLADQLKHAREAWLLAFAEFARTQADLDDELTAPRR